ncbi:hypothetical protein BSKO_03204 [Bryopsis sp. KO-2023]|nr:hypothetical protein BSKO_03204 [Bryopsis sp. KO-2023]
MSSFCSPWSTWLVVGVAILLRLCVGLGRYSGADNHPKYGDYEAQRHWMEITTNLPVLDWYRQTPDNDLSYWGLDYPPLTAYQSWLYGKVIEKLDPKSVELHESRGHQHSKLLMRWSVLISDSILIFSSILWANTVRPQQPKRNQLATIAILLAVLLQPPCILIDHGHFQYNGISLGLTLLATVVICKGWHCLGSILYCCAINHKHMALYFAPAFFGYLFGCCLKRGAVKGLGKFFALGFTVIGTFAVLWLPFIQNPAQGNYLAVISRLVPLERGVFEDYVASFWCATKPLLKWKERFDPGSMFRLCTLATVASFTPSMIHQIAKPSQTGFVYSMANSALGFFLFSYQVHEKSILLALLPITMLAVDEPHLAQWLPIVASFSMYPLLERDGLILQYFAMIILYACLPIVELLSNNPPKRPHSPRSTKDILFVSWMWFSGVIMCALHFARAAIPAHGSLPYIHDALFVGFSFVQFLGVYVYLNVRQLARSDLHGKVKTV